jgi:hypothetical protein
VNLPWAQLKAIAQAIFPHFQINLWFPEGAGQSSQWLRDPNSSLFEPNTLHYKTHFIHFFSLAAPIIIRVVCIRGFFYSFQKSERDAVVNISFNYFRPAWVSICAPSRIIICTYAHTMQFKSAAQPLCILLPLAFKKSSKVVFSFSLSLFKKNLTHVLPRKPRREEISPRRARRRCNLKI